MGCWHRRRVLAALTLLSMMLGGAWAAGDPPPRAPGAPVPKPELPRPFDRGSMSLGLVMGISTGQSTAFTLGGGFGYFVLPGLEPGLTLDVTFGSDRPTVIALMPYLRWVIWRSYVVSPFIKAQAGRWFITDDVPDLTVVGGGGGLVLFLFGQQAGLQVEGLVYRLFPGESCPGGSCWATSFGFSIGLYFGGKRPAPPPPPPAPAPPPPQRPPAMVPRATPASRPQHPTPPHTEPAPEDAPRDEPAP